MSEGLVFVLAALLGYGIYRLGYYRGRRRAISEYTLDTYEHWHQLAHEKDKKPNRPFS